MVNIRALRRKNEPICVGPLAFVLANPAGNDARRVEAISEWPRFRFWLKASEDRGGGKASGRACQATGDPPMRSFLVCLERSLVFALRGQA